MSNNPADAADIVNPCHCGGSPQLMLSRDGEAEWLRCPKCGREGPVHYSKAAAVSGWNSGKERAGYSASITSEIAALRAREAELQRKLDAAVKLILAWADWEASFCDGPRDDHPFLPTVDELLTAIRGEG